MGVDALAVVKDKEEFLKIVNSIMLEKDWYNYELASCLKICSSRLSDILRGKRGLSLGKFFLISKALGCEVVIRPNRGELYRQRNDYKY